MTKQTESAIGMLALAVMVLAMLFGLAQAEEQYRPLTFYTDRPACADVRQVYVVTSPYTRGRYVWSKAVWVCGLGQ